MKTQLKLSFFTLLAITLMSVSVKAQGKRYKVIDSLNVTDPDERKVMMLYDDIITDYLTEWKDLATDPKKFSSTYRNEIDAKYKARGKEIQPSVENLKKKFQGNYAEAMKFAQYMSYETQRMMVIYQKYQTQYMKAAGH